MLEHFRKQVMCNPTYTSSGFESTTSRTVGAKLNNQQSHLNILYSSMHERLTTRNTAQLSHVRFNSSSNLLKYTAICMQNAILLLVHLFVTQYTFTSLLLTLVFCSKAYELCLLYHLTRQPVSF